MCSRTTCPSCHRPTFVGCGMHVEQVLGDVAPDDRCACKGAPAPRPRVGRWRFGRRA